MLSFVKSKLINNFQRGVWFSQHCFWRGKNFAGFTTIELLVVIAIIALLSSVLMVSLLEIRVSARDARRRDDSLVLRTALQWYYHEKGFYPYGNSIGNPNQEVDIQRLAPYLVPSFMQRVPDDPLKQISNYQYVWKNNGQDYGLFIPFSNDGEAGCMYITANGSKNWFGKAELCQF